jgi:TetR/AcrR family transcriptional repressor of mexJK operon
MSGQMAPVRTADSAAHDADPALRRRGPGRPSLSNEELLDTALDLFLEHGFERTSIEAITAAAGMAKRTVYARYGDKLSLFKAAIRRAIEDWIVPVEALCRAETDDLEQTLQQVGKLLVQNILSPAGLRLLRLTNAEANHVADIGAYNVRLGTEPTLAYLKDLFERRLPFCADMGEASDAAESFLNLVVGGPASNAAWGVPIDAETIERHRRYSVQLFLNGVLPRAERPNVDRERVNALSGLLDDVSQQIEAAQRRLDEINRLAR